MEDQRIKIHHLEIIAVVVSLKVLKERLRSKRFIMLCDNQAEVEVINAGATRDKIMQEWLRELTFVAVMGQFEVVMRYISTRGNRIPDILSRLHQDTKYEKQWEQIKEKEWEMEEVQDELFLLNSLW